MAQERVFVVALVNASQEAKDKAKPSRVDLGVKQAGKSSPRICADQRG